MRCGRPRGVATRRAEITAGSAGRPTPVAGRQRVSATSGPLPGARPRVSRRAPAPHVSRGPPSAPEPAREGDLLGPREEGRAPEDAQVERATERARRGATRAPPRAARVPHAQVVVTDRHRDRAARETDEVVRDPKVQVEAPQVSPATADAQEAPAEHDLSRFADLRRCANGAGLTEADALHNRGLEPTRRNHAVGRGGVPDVLINGEGANVLGGARHRGPAACGVGQQRAARSPHDEPRLERSVPGVAAT